MFFKIVFRIQKICIKNNNIELDYYAFFWLCEMKIFFSENKILLQKYFFNKTKGEQKIIYIKGFI